jgi:hypothetical protein
MGITRRTSTLPLMANMGQPSTSAEAVVKRFGFYHNVPPDSFLLFQHRAVCNYCYRTLLTLPSAPNRLPGSANLF